MKNKSAVSKFIFWIFFREGLRMKGEPLVCASEYEVKSSLSFLLLGSCACSFFERLPLDFCRLFKIATINRGK